MVKSAIETPYKSPEALREPQTIPDVEKVDLGVFNYPPTNIPEVSQGENPGEIIKITYDKGYEPKPGIAGDAKHRRYRNAKGQFITKSVINRIEAPLKSNKNADVEQLPADEEINELAGVEELREVRDKAMLLLIDIQEIRKERELTAEELAESRIYAKSILSLNNQVSELAGLNDETRQGNQKILAGVLTDIGFRLDTDNETELAILEDVFDNVYESLESNNELSEVQVDDLEEYLVALNHRIITIEGNVDDTSSSIDNQNLLDKLSQFRARRIADQELASVESIQDIEYSSDAEESLAEFLANNFGDVNKIIQDLSDDKFKLVNSNLSEVENLTLFIEEELIKKRLLEGISSKEINADIITFRQREAKRILNQVYVLRQAKLKEQVVGKTELDNLDDIFIELSNELSKNILENVRYDDDGILISSGNVAYNFVIDFTNKIPAPVASRALVPVPLPEIYKAKNHNKRWVAAASLVGIFAAAGLFLASDSNSDENTSDIPAAVSEVESPEPTDDQIPTTTASANDNDQGSDEEATTPPAEVVVTGTESDGSDEGQPAAQEDEVSDDSGASSEAADSDSSVEPSVDNSIETVHDIEVYKTLWIPDEAGFQRSIHRQYGLSDVDSWNAYKAIEPFVTGAPGTYFGPNRDIRLSAPGQFELSDDAAKALKQFIETLNESDS